MADYQLVRAICPNEGIVFYLNMLVVNVVWWS